MAALEAMAAGMPVVLSPGCNMDEIEDDGAGFVVEPTVDAFASRLSELVVNADLRREMGTNAQLLVGEQFSWNRIAARLEDVYRSLL